MRKCTYIVVIAGYYMFFTMLFFANSADGDMDNDDCVMYHQSQWQRHILALYGTIVCLVDCTYNTTVYDMPLLTLGVRTNCGYFYAATALITSESTVHVTNALRHVRDTNPNWHPVVFVCDFSEAIIGAITVI